MTLLGAAGAGLVLRVTTDAQGQDLTVAGQPVELRITSLSPQTIRVSLLPRAAAASALNADGALVNFSEETRTAASAASISVGDLKLAVTDGPLTVTMSDSAGTVVQRLVVPETGGLEFSIGEAPLLGFGEGGPQFDRRGAVDAMRNGQGGYQLRTHGGRVRAERAPQQTERIAPRLTHSLHGDLPSA